MSEHAQLQHLQVPAPLGVGFSYVPLLSPALYRPGLLDFVEITPETLCQQRPSAGGSTLHPVAAKLEEAQATCGTLPITVHGVELSIGSAHGWNAAYLAMLDAFQRAWPFVWHSEHLSFQTMRDDNGMSVEIGVPLPLPPTRETVELVAGRSASIKQRYRVPFLLENPAYYLTDLPCDSGLGDEVDLMRAITASAGIGQLLDLHNLYCNAVNHHLDPTAMIDRIALDRVVEIHIAGGSWLGGYWMDAHDGPVAAPVWDLLEYTLPRCPNIAGIVFEMLEEHAVHLGEVAIESELVHARDVWTRRACTAARPGERATA